MTERPTEATRHGGDVEDGSQSSWDAIIDRFEACWLAGKTPPDVIEYCRQVSDPSQSANVENDGDACFQPPSLVFQLAVVDLELSWRVGPEKSRRDTDWYRKELGRFGMTEQEVKVLAWNEMEIRSRWGDRPRIDAMVAKQFPAASIAQREQIQAEYRHQLESRFPIHCIVSTDFHHRTRVTLKTPCVLGRQRLNDPPAGGPPYYSSEHRIWRMVVVGKDEVHVSRDQVRFDRLSANELRITAISPAVGCYLDGKRIATASPIEVSVEPSGAAVVFSDLQVSLRRV
jgi:hypothetical protein